MKKLSEDVEVIANAIRESKDFLEVSEDGLRVRRTTDLPDDLDLNANTVYMKGFDQDKSLDDITAFLEENGVAPKCVRMRFYKDKSGKKFKGSVFIQLASEEAVKEFLEKKFDGYITKTKVDYDAEKAAEKGGKTFTPVDTKFTPSEFVKGLLFKLTGLSHNIRRETLKEWVENIGGKVAYVEFEQGKTEAVLRLNETSPIKAAEAIEKLTAKADELKAANDDNEITFSVVEGDEETTAWEAIEAAKAEKRQNFSQKRKFGGNSKGGNKFGGQKRQRRDRD